MRYLIYYIAIFFAVACSGTESGENEPTTTPDPDPDPPTQTESIATLSVGNIAMVDNGDVEMVTSSWSSSGADEITAFVANSTVVNGGVLRVSFDSATKYSHLIVGSGGGSSAIRVATSAVSGDLYSYSFMVLIDQSCTSSFDLYVAGESGGVQGRPYTHSIDIEPVRSEGLQIVLGFDSDEDMDLHLFMPMAIGSGSELYFGNQGLCDEFDEVICGFDVMANNNCQGLEEEFRYESISIPDGYLTSGEYVVKVNLYSICTAYPERSTNYVVCAMYGGELLAIADGSLNGDDENRVDLDRYTEAFVVSLDLSEAISLCARSGGGGRVIELAAAERAKLYYRGW